MPDRFVEIEVENYIATLSLANNKNLNALTVDFAAEITESVKALDAREDVRVIILKSNARIFCAGLDLKGLMSLELLGCGAKTAYYFQDKLQALFDCCNIMEICRKPIIAAVHGMCIGGGLDMISACDIRLCTEDASFCLKEAAIGMVADMGVLQRLPHIIGQGFTREMAYTARLYSSREAERMGLVTAVYPDQETLLAEAKTLAGQICENGPLGVMATKEVLNYSRTASIEEGMHMGIQKNAVLMSSKDIPEAVKAFLEKRKPNFKGE